MRVTSRRLIVIRHAKAEPYATTDHDRALSDRGLRDATAAGEYLAAQGLVPDHAVVSSAVRTVATWAQVAQVCGWTLEPQLDRSVYAGSADVVLDVLRAAPEEARTVLLVGHNPAVSYLVHDLDDGNGDPEATNAMLRGYPPASVAVLEIDVPWSELGPATGRVVDFHSSGA